VSDDFNPAVEADLIVAGRVTHVVANEKGAAPGYVQIRLTLQVDRYLKGSGPSTIDVIDSRSAMLVRPGAGGTGADYLNVPLTDISWGGGGGFCGTLDESPSGKYFVGGLSETGPKRFEASRPLMFAWGSGPDDPRVVGGIARATLALRAAPLPPATGNAGLDQQGLAAIVQALILAATLTAASRRITRKA
jgi:hypothetical protein